MYGMHTDSTLYTWGAYTGTFSWRYVRFKVKFYNIFKKDTKLYCVYICISRDLFHKTLIFHGLEIQKKLAIEMWFLIVFSRNRSTKSLPSNWQIITVLLGRYLTSWLKNSHFSSYISAFRHMRDKRVIKSWNVSTTNNLEDCLHEGKAVI